MSWVAASGRGRGAAARSRGIGIAALLVVSAVVAVFGLVQAGLISRGGAVAGPPDTHAGLDGLRAAVTGAQWVQADHDDPTIKDGSGNSATGYQMPAQMMPGMPAEGQSRLLVKLDLANHAADAKLLDAPTEFVLRDERGDRYPAQGDTFGGFTRLNPSNGVTGGVYFDVPTDGAASRTWQLEWIRHGHTVRLAVTATGTVHAH
jgi:hypothetical protein